MGKLNDYPTVYREENCKIMEEDKINEAIEKEFSICNIKYLLS